MSKKRNNASSENDKTISEITDEKETKKESPKNRTVLNKINRPHVRWLLVVYDALIYTVVSFLILWLNPSAAEPPSVQTFIINYIVGAVVLLVFRFLLKIYYQIWRYGGIQSYIRIIVSDAAAFWVSYIVLMLLPTHRIIFIRLLALFSMNLLGALTIRMMYRYAYKCCRGNSLISRFMKILLRIASFNHDKTDTADEKGTSVPKINVAIIGAGRVGVGLAEELLNNKQSIYNPCCFVDTNTAKTGRQVYNIPVLQESQDILRILSDFDVQEIIFALPESTVEERKSLYEFYKKSGCKIKIYDYPTMRTADSSKMYLREFDIDELLFRHQMDFLSEKANAYYRDKVIMITGGGGSIGSELCRQIARMGPRKLIVLDVYENGAYDIQQELKLAYKDLDISIEILSVCDRQALEHVFQVYKPQIILHAAAHKHVPLMEHNCIEAVKNNVFGTLNTVELAEKYKAERFIMVSTDKAVNPTNVMGATKRMCEMIVQCHSTTGSRTVFSATRFGNVLGSAGSVIPLFKRQIHNGGPLTLTDKRIIRYFMTIPEASQLVLESGHMAKNGELFVLDMGKPVKILDLAENMIKMSGYEPYVDIDIIETGLRPGEKLYEELLISSETLSKTDNKMIFVEKDKALSENELEEKLAILRKAVQEDDEAVRAALHKVVPTFRRPEEVNAVAANAVEMKNAADHSIFASGTHEKEPAGVK